MRIIPDEKMEKAINYLAEHDALAAELLAEMERTELKAKAVKDALIAHGEGGVGERTAAAGCAKEYLDAMELYFTAVRDYNTVKNRRSTAALIVDVWRSENANRRQG